MFDIEYKGGNGVIIATKKTQIVIDPQLSVVGLKNVSVKDAVELATEARFAVNDESARLQVEGPGEYEIGDVSIKGIRATRHLDTTADEPVSTIYKIDIGDTRLAVIGNITPKLDESQLEEIGLIDILIIPVGGNGYTLDATSAATIVRQVEPKIVIPIHYADAAVKYEVPQDTLEVFTKELTAPIEDSGSKYKLKSATSLPLVLTIVILNRN